MKLVGTLTSPFVRKVRVALAEKKIDYDFDLESPWAENTQISRINPLGKVPVLQHKDGSSLFDSRVIVEYIDNLSPSKRLIPANGRERMQVLRWEALADGISEAVVAIVLEKRRLQKKQDADWIARQQTKVSLGLKAVSEDLTDHAWAAGSQFSLADIALGVALGYLTFRFPENNWREQYPNLGAHLDKLMTRPSFIETTPREQ